MIIIPARLESSRFKHKVLQDIGGLPMVVRTAKAVEDIDRVVVACDSKKILDICKDHGVEAHLTSTTHKSGTDRINECISLLNTDPQEHIINLQADEPFIEQEVVKLLLERLKQIESEGREFVMASCYNAINATSASDPNLVKVLLDNNQNAIYFSRECIPYDRSGLATYFGHIGIYGFNAKSLKQFCSLDDTTLENIEKLEQLRAIYHSLPISMVKVVSTSFGIDTQEDLDKAKEIFGF